MNEKIQVLHIPKGGMCTVCFYGNSNCQALPFSTYPVLEKVYEAGVHTISVVKCNDFTRTKRP